MTFHDLLLNKSWLKFFSLVLATLIWIVINTNFSPTEIRLPQNPLRPTATRDLLEPVIVMTSASNRRLYHIDPPEVRVTVRGEAAIVGRLDPDEVQVFVRLVDVADAQGSFRLEVKAPPQVSAEDVTISPPNVRVMPLPNAAPPPKPPAH